MWLETVWAISIMLPEEAGNNKRIERQADQ